ncbi:hypothetical protein MRX96_050148 [Rhipicephalus microplus]
MRRLQQYLASKRVIISRELGNHVALEKATAAQNSTRHNCHREEEAMDGAASVVRRGQYAAEGNAALLGMLNCWKPSFRSGV